MWSICGLCLCSSRKWSTKVSTISSSVSLTVVLFFMKVYLRNYLPPSHTAAIIQSDNKNIWQAVCVKLLSIMVSQPTGDSSVPVSISIPQVKLKCPVHVSSYITVWKHLFGNKSSPRIWLLRSLSSGRCKLICIFTLVTGIHDSLMFRFRMSFKSSKMRSSIFALITSVFDPFMHIFLMSV